MNRKFKKLRTIIDKGRSGEAPVIPLTVLGGMASDIDIGRGDYTLVGGDSGSGKSALVDWFYILWPYIWWSNAVKKEETNIKLQIIVRSMERSLELRVAKWVCLYVYKKYKIILDVRKIFGRSNILTDDEYEKVKEGIEYFEKASDIIHIFPGAVNPTGIWHDLVSFAEQHGTIVKDERDKIIEYVPNDDNLIVIFVIDHIGKARPERAYPDGPVLNEKQVIDRLSHYVADARDIFGFSPVVVQQFNRGIGSVGRRTHMDLTPERIDFKGSGNMFEDCDVALTVFYPHVYGIKTWKGKDGYLIGKMTGENGANRFRGLSLLKNHLGTDNLHMGLHFLGEVGLYEPMPPVIEMTPSLYYKLANPLDPI